MMIMDGAWCSLKPLNLLIYSSSSIPALPFVHNTKYILHTSISTSSLMTNKHPLKCLMATESDSLPSPDLNSHFQHLVDCFIILPDDYFKQLPTDLRLDLNDAAFDLSNGPVIDQCGLELGETLLNITRAWEAADTSTSTTLVGKLPMLVVSASANNKSAFGKRLLSSGRRFQSMGQYGDGELQKYQIAEAMVTIGKLLSANPVSSATDEEPAQETRMFKFGELQVALTAEKAYIGALIAFIFGVLSWELSQGIQSIPESSLQYANENALLLAKSLRGALLAVCYTSTVLSAFTAGGLVLLGGQLKSEPK
ncbi:Ammonium transporter member [Heracleum sosnowskyi]|uniref:Ammonium transporter member n=1 Tax=Heracleum sosnowskyi TaxID=360622 RepID=A0AAD8MPF0_9APIA|nr:Ammonium transporter member [Heracleum sosnowskyi]